MVREITPWQTTPNLMDTRRTPDLEKAKEVTPILMFGVLPPFVVHPSGTDFRPVDHEAPTVTEKVEAEVVADADPKGQNVTSSATDNASSSGTGTSENGQQTQDDPLMKLHPSSLPPSPETLASAVKALNEEPPPFSAL